MKILFFPISVHCWGGLGSQLFAWAIVEKLKIKFPNRRVRIILHTSGVTERFSEIDFLSNELTIKKISDFKSLTNGSRLFGKLSKALFISGMISNSNSDIEFESLKPWVLMLRGHYSYQSLSTEIIYGLLKKYTDLNNESISPFNSQIEGTLGIHYRLGDLLSLNTKSIISPDQVGNSLLFCLGQNKINQIILCSDSISQALALLSPFMTDKYVVAPKASILETIKILVECQYFIGTNSKISIWIILFRKVLDPNSFASIPLEMHTQIHQNIADSNLLNNIKYY